MLQPSQHEKTHLELIIDVSTTRAATLAALLHLEVTPLGTAAGECSQNARPCKLGSHSLDVLALALCMVDNGIDEPLVQLCFFFDRL